MNGSRFYEFKLLIGFKLDLPPINFIEFTQ